jgi:Dolichyl-phosphate-mannose-protein mannosyltransferase
MNPTDELQAESAGEHRGLTTGLRSRLVHALDESASFLEAVPSAIFVMLLLPYLVALGIHVSSRPLWHDELYTFYIAQAPTFRQMLQQTRTLDLNPPLSYAAVRFVFHFLSPGLVSTRLPSVIAFFAATLLLYSFVRRRTNRIYGAMAAFLLLGSNYAINAFEARPYALVLAFLAVAAVGWQRAMEGDDRSRWWGLLILVLGGFGMLLSHVLALVAYGAFFFAEVVRLVLRRKPDWPLWLCLLLPLICGILYVPLLRHHNTGVFPPAFQASLLRLSDQDGPFWINLFTLLGVASVLIVTVCGRRLSSGGTQNGESFTVPEGAFAVYLLLVPFMITILFMHSHSAYFGRYGIPAVFGAGILAPWLIAYWTRGDRVAGLLGVLVFAFGMAPPATLLLYAKDVFHRPEPNAALTGDSTTPFTQIEPELPFVDASGLTFVEMNSREDMEFLSRLYYLSDEQAALQYSHATIFEGLNTVKNIFPLRANVEPYQRFVQEHPRFLVYGTYDYPEDWLLRKLLVDGASLRFLGNFPDQYKDSTLYEVTLPPR